MYFRLTSKHLNIFKFPMYVVFMKYVMGIGHFERVVTMEKM